jgi:hypothetical protein
MNSVQTSPSGRPRPRKKNEPDGRDLRATRLIRKPGSRKCPRTTPSGVRDDDSCGCRAPVARTELDASPRLERAAPAWFRTRKAPESEGAVACTSSRSSWFGGGAARMDAALCFGRRERGSGSLFDDVTEVEGRVCPERGDVGRMPGRAGRLDLRSQQPGEARLGPLPATCVSRETARPRSCDEVSSSGSWGKLDVAERVGLPGAFCETRPLAPPLFHVKRELAVALPRVGTRRAVSIARARGREGCSVSRPHWPPTGAAPEEGGLRSGDS